MLTPIKTDRELDAMREGGKILATILDLLIGKAEVGVTPRELAVIAAAEIKKHGASAPFLGYHGFPDVICISVNNQVQHCIPNNRPFQEGDVVNFDFGVTYKGLITDAGVTIGIGKLSSDDQRLVDGTKAALDAALGIIKNGVRVGDISNAIESVLVEQDLGIVRELVGHGVGHDLHEEPDIPNYGWAKTGPILKTGMTIAVEPITTLGDEDIYIDKDGQSIYTVDGSKSAQFEHTILVLDKGCEILTTL